MTIGYPDLAALPPELRDAVIKHGSPNVYRMIVHSPGLPWDRRLPPLLRRPGSTSSILLPVHWTRRGVSVVELWTTEEDRAVLGIAELSKVLTLVAAS